MNDVTIHMLKTNVKGQLAGADIGGGICIAGSPGIGKTKNMYQIAADLNMNILQISIPEISTENLSGIPDFMDATHMDVYSLDGTKNSKSTKWSVPQIIETANRLAKDAGKEGCILFIDDLHRVNMAVAPYLYGLLGERKLGSFKLDAKVAIMAAMNDSDEAGFSGMDSPIKDRISILPVPFDFNYWFANFGRSLHFYVSSFLKAHSKYVQEDESTMIEQFGTPRSWTHLANEFELYDTKFIQQHTSLLARQKVSLSAAEELAKHIAYIEAIDFTAKVKNRAKMDIKAMKPIDQILYAYIINYVDTIEDAEYVMKLIDSNIDCDNFAGFVTGELYTKFLAMEDKKTISNGARLLVTKLTKGTFEREQYTEMTDREARIAEDIDFKHLTRLYSIASDFIH